MSRYDSEFTLIRLTHLLLERLDELNGPADENDDADFMLGSKTAYVECLEAIQDTWENSAIVGIPDDIEDRYPI